LDGQVQVDVGRVLRRIGPGRRRAAASQQKIGSWNKYKHGSQELYLGPRL
jgi:hypothetical protein